LFLQTREKKRIKKKKSNFLICGDYSSNIDKLN